MDDAQPIRSPDVRVMNEKLILRLIRQNQGLSQSEAAQITGLKPPSVFRIFTVLEERKLIMPVPTQAPKGVKKGRRPVTFVVNPDAYYVVGIDFWSKHISIVIVDFSGRTLCRDVVAVDKAEAEAVVSQIVQLIRSRLKATRTPQKRVLGIGIGCPGMIDFDEGTIRHYPRISGMVNFPIRNKIAEAFRTDVYIHNTSSVVALSEYSYGFAKEYDSLLVILVRSGVGGAFISDGKLFVNHNKTALEIGHMSVNIEGRKCKCGARGCIEAYLSEDALLSDVEKADGIRSIEDLEAAVINGNTEVISELRKTAEVLALGIRNLIQLFSPKAFLIVSRSKKVFELLADQAAEILQKDSYVSERESIIILAEEYRAEIAGKGASDLVIDAFFGEGSR
jgi:predicted NBD/HSP70 family sugar kinase